MWQMTIWLEAVVKEMRGNEIVGSSAVVVEV